MRSPDQVRWDFVQSWLAKASQDLRAASILVGEEFDDYQTSAFHAQQASEKFLKAFLVRHQIEFPKTHDIKELRELVSKVDEGLAQALSVADGLTPYGVEFRYPGELQPVDREKAKKSRYHKTFLSN